MATILVIDDSSVIRHLLSHTLKHNGHHVITLACGDEALGLLETETVDVVIADLEMPSMDGITLLKHIRSGERTCEIPLLMLTASGNEQDREDAQAAGANGFLTKPASSRDLVTAVERLLHANQSAL
ncbi:response regulator [Candidatus Chloroploca sp. Khr17]|uniref:response regulator n=1 Tax=Candidatus Chloroploca sp. Khr17 TaxID=2496869 RepID=UPI00101CB0F2|nr:response regulator [Candidatus Chloroploca sp. Khr17]